MGRILVIDDTRFMRTLLKNILFSGGYDIVDEAADRAKAAAGYQELKPDLVTMDAVMPKVNTGARRSRPLSQQQKSSYVQRSARSRWSCLP